MIDIWKAGITNCAILTVAAAFNVGSFFNLSVFIYCFTYIIFESSKGTSRFDPACVIVSVCPHGNENDI